MLGRDELRSSLLEEEGEEIATMAVALAMSLESLLGQERLGASAASQPLVRHRHDLGQVVRWLQGLFELDFPI